MEKLDWSVEWEVIGDAFWGEGLKIYERVD
jgi:hypothetical protein